MSRTLNADRRSCGISTQVVDRSANSVTCSLCCCVFHSSCYYQPTDTHMVTDIWLCCCCICDVLPFTSDESDFKESVITMDYTNFDLIDDNLVLEVFADEPVAGAIPTEIDTDPDHNIALITLTGTALTPP